MRIVLVDPSRTVRRIITKLVEQRGYEVFPFADGAEALAFIQKDESVRALLTSAEMPNLSGVELCARVREHLANSRPLYIIMMSSNDELTKCIQALDHGADDFIRKPPMPEELGARLRTADRVTTMQSELVRLASVDFLTGLYNRRSFFEYAAKIFKRAPNGHAVSAIMFDLDHFKKINDAHGHDIGDAVLRRVAAEVALLPGTASRLGGEEFGLLVETNLADTIDLANDLRRSVERLKIFSSDQPVPVTCSLGVAEWEVGDTIDILLRRADVALFEAKRTGRNKVVAADTHALSDEHKKWRGAARFADRPS